MTLLILTLTSLLCFSQSYKAEGFKSALMQTKTGAMVVYTGETHSFTIEIIGNDIKPSDKPNFMTVDNKILQSSIIPFQTQLEFEKLSEEAQKKNLLSYMDYEMKYIKDQLKAKNLNENNEFISLNNELFLFWTYDMPKSYKTIDKQCYLVTICFDQMLILNSPVDSGKSFKEIKDFLLNIGNTIKLSDHSIDLNKLYEELNKK
jgi:hypothetical protein